MVTSDYHHGHSDWELGVTVTTAVLVTLLFWVWVVHPKAPPPEDADGPQYVKMAEAGPCSTGVPYRYRILVPLIAGCLPCSARRAFEVVSLLSLGGLYMVVLAMNRHCGISLVPSVMGLVTTAASTWHLSAYRYPDRVDAFQWLCLAGMVYALLRRWFWVYAAASIAGCLAHETTIFLVPAWFLVRDARRGVGCILFSVLAVLAPRLMLRDAAPLSGVVHDQLTRVWHDRTAWYVVASVWQAWGVLWFVALSSILLVPRRALRVAAVSSALLGAGAVLASLIASDIGRMFARLFPVMVLLTGVWYQRLGRRSIALAGILLVLLVVMGLFTFDNIGMHAMNRCLGLGEADASSFHPIARVLWRVSVPVLVLSFWALRTELEATGPAAMRRICASFAGLPVLLWRTGRSLRARWHRTV